MNKLKPSKILFLLHIPPPVHGSSVVGLSIKESTIINSEFNTIYINLLASQNMAETGTVNLNKLLGFLVTWLKVLVAIIKERPNLCYLALTTTGAAFFKDLILVVLLKIFRIKRIYHLHNKGISLHQHKLSYRLCYDFVFKKSDVILLSNLLYPDIKEFVQQSKVHVCPNGIPFQDIKMANSSFDEIGKEKKIVRPVQILFLSNLIESKGVFILLEACAILKRKNVLFECIFIGGESDVTVINFNERVHQLELDDFVCYQGKKYGEEKNEAFAKADIFVFPTYYYYETFGLVNLEAMQQSKPVISTFEGGIPDVIEDGVTGFLVKQKDAFALSEKLELLISNPTLRLQMGLAGRKKYENEFTQEIFENRLTAILQQVINIQL